MMNLLEVITQSYRMANVLLGAGRGISGSQQAEGLHVYNAMLDGVKAQRPFVYQVLRGLFASQIGKKDYTVGDAGLGADWVVERPEHVLSAGVLVPGAPSPTEAEIPVFVVRSYEQYQDIICKTVQSTLPQVLWYQAALPLGIATIWPVPSQIYSMVLYTPQTVQEFTDIEADFIVPKGFREFLEYEGAVKIHQRYPHAPPMNQTVIDMAKEYKARVAANQWTPTFIKSDGAVRRPGGSGADWFNGRTLLPG